MSVPDRLLLPSNKKSAILRLRMIALLSTHQDLDWTKLRTQLERAPSLSFERSLVYGQVSQSSLL